MKKYFEVKSGENILRGISNIPNALKKTPCLIVCHGFTGNKNEAHFMFSKLADILENMGIATFRFDFSGSGDSDGKFKDMTFMKEVIDCENVISYVEGLDFIDLDNINLIGLSMGGAVSAVVSGRNPEKIKNTILLSPAMNIHEVFTGNFERYQIDTYMNKGYVDYGGNILGREAIDEVFRLNLYEYAGKINGNVLLIHGTQDETVTPYTSIRLHEILKDKASLHFIEGADHCYCSMAYEQEVLEIIKDFCSKNIIYGLK